MNRISATQIGLWTLVVLFFISCKRIDDTGAAVRQLPLFTTASGVEIVLIPAGEFEMGSDRGNDDEAPVYRLRVGSFLMDRYEVT